MIYEVGDIVKLKKPHPGSCEWEILRVGADFRLKCTGVRPSDYDAPEAGGKKYQRTAQKSGKLTFGPVYGMIETRDIQ